MTRAVGVVRMWAVAGLVLAGATATLAQGARTEGPPPPPGATKEKAAQGLGFANGVYDSAKCADQKDAANSLSDDLLAFWRFSADEFEGRGPVGKLVLAGRATATREVRAARDCGRIGERLAQWRAEVLPR